MLLKSEIGISLYFILKYYALHLMSSESGQMIDDSRRMLRQVQWFNVLYNNIGTNNREKLSKEVEVGFTPMYFDLRLE